MTRQGASKIVAGLLARRYVTLTASPTDGREKIVRLAPRAVEYLAAHRRTARKIERRMRAEIGADAFDGLCMLLDALAGDDQLRMRDYLSRATDQGSYGYLED